MSSVKRFVARSAREALAMVKADLGGDAVVLSNRAIEGGVEIMAAPPAVLAALAPAASAPRTESDPDFKVSLSRNLASRAEPRRWKPLSVPRVAAAAANPRTPPPAPRAPAAPARVDASESAPAAAEGGAPSASPAPIRGGGRSPAEAALSPRLVEELQSIRGLIERQLAGFAWGELARRTPVGSALLSELLEAGFSAELARRLSECVPDDADEATGRNVLRAALGRELVTIGSDADVIDRGGVYALVGPTGVGKTTTTAKLAARCVVRHGAEKVALLTTDGYRIGAHEQLRIYGRILGIAVHAVRDAADLRQALHDLSRKHMVLIDTVGMSQRDRQVAEQAAMLTSAGHVRRLLLLNATSRGEILDDVVRAYSGPDLVGCVITKVDEAGSLAPVLDALIRHELELFYVSNGQRVPEDLHLPNRAYLLHRGLKGLAQRSPHRLRPEEAAMVFAASRSDELVWGGAVA